MRSNLEIAQLFSMGKFNQVTDRLSDNVEFHIYEDDQHLKGKENVLDFCKDIAAYFASMETDFQESGYLVDRSKVVIYGSGTFQRDGKLISMVHSCDVYEFDDSGMIQNIKSYCNSRKP